MPGMMDTILNVGIDPTNEKEYRALLGDKCFEDSYHRLITMFGSTVYDLPRTKLEAGSYKDALAFFHSVTGKPFPNAEEQILKSIEAVFLSWNSERAKAYRKQHNIPQEWGTAVTIQSMVFGNFNDKSATGVLFTRNPDTGEDKIQGEFLVNAQGEDVVAGIRTPEPLENMAKWNPLVYSELIATVKMLEHLKGDAQDIEFTIQNGKLYILQTRNAKRSAQATIRIAIDMGRWKDVSVEHLDSARVPFVKPEFVQANPPAFVGIPASSGVVTGKPVFSAKDAIGCNEPCILITKETTPEDYAGMLAAKGVITMEGGLTSHAAVVARGENIPCVTGVGANLKDFKGAKVVSFDGSTGNIWLGPIEMEPGKDTLVNEYLWKNAEHAGVVPMVGPEDIPNIPAGTKEVVLVLGPAIMSLPKAYEYVTSACKKVDKLYLDLTPDTNPYFKIFGFSFDYTGRLVGELGALKNKLVLVGRSTPGFFSLGSTGDLAELILSKGGVALVGDADEATTKVLQWKKAEGATFYSFGNFKGELKSMVPLITAVIERGE
jgi:phosphohistidine swiveling domain-containing protein